MKKFSALIILLTTGLASSGIARAAEDSTPIPVMSDAWRFEVTPYLWAPGIKGTLGLDSGLAKSADFTTSNVLGALKSGGMISAEAHKGSWGVMGDVVSATLQKTSGVSVATPYGTANIADKITLQQTVLTGVATYTVANNKDAYVDALLGVRAIYATATVNLNLTGTSDKASVSKTTSTVDPIIGAKGRYRIADSTWYVPFYGDIGSGGGTTNLTWQAMAGVGKTFSSLIDASLTYRALYYDMKEGGVMQKTTMLGPQVAVTFKF
ncbi:MAG: hypothetical protein V4536_04260 [Pseudomonadota bacterium]